MSFVPVWMDGAEHDVGGTDLDDGQSLVTNQFGGTVISNVTSPVASGARAYRFNTVASACWGYKTGLSASSFWEGCFKVWLTTAPSVDRIIFQVVTTGDLGQGQIGITSAGNAYAAIHRDPGGTQATQAGDAIPVDTWVLIEWAVDFSTTSWVVYWYVAGVEQTPCTWTAPDSRAPDGISFGAVGTPATGDHYMDDMVAASGSISEHPIGDRTILSYLPNRVGTHNLEASPSNSFFKDIATVETALTSVETTSYQVIDNRLANTSGDHVLVGPDASLSSSNYVEYGFEAVGAVPDAVRAYTTIGQDSATADAIVVRLRDGGSDIDIFNGAISSTNPLNYALMMASKPSGGAWTMDAFNDMLLRYGFSTDVDGRVRLYGVVLEALFGGAEAGPLDFYRPRIGWPRMVRG